MTTAEAMPAGTRLPWRPIHRLTQANGGGGEVPEPPGMPRPVEPEPAPKPATKGGSMVGALVGGALGFVVLRSAVGAGAGAAIGYFVGPTSTPKPKADPACLDGLTPKQRELAEFLLTASPGSAIPGDIDWTQGVLSPATLRLAAIEAEEGGFTKLASCLRERADRVEGA